MLVSLEFRSLVSPTNDFITIISAELFISHLLIDVVTIYKPSTIDHGGNTSIELLSYFVHLMLEQEPWIAKIRPSMVVVAKAWLCKKPIKYGSH